MKTPSSSSHRMEEYSLCLTSDTPYNNRDCLGTGDPLSSSSSSAAAAVVSAGQSMSSVEHLLASINDQLESRIRIDAQQRHQTDRNQQMMSEWITAAAVVDRFCFLIFSICFLIGTTVFFILAVFHSSKNNED